MKDISNYHKNIKKIFIRTFRIIKTNRYLLLFLLLSIFFDIFTNNNIYTFYKDYSFAKVKENNQNIQPSSELDRFLDIIPSSAKLYIINSNKTFSDPRAKQGGSLNLNLFSFPLTFRIHGADSYSSISSFLKENQLSLIFFHPNTNDPLPSLAKRWAISQDKRTVFYQLDHNAIWSDGHKVKVSDFTFIEKFINSKFTNANQLKNYHQLHKIKIKALDNDIISISVSKSHYPIKLLQLTNLKPIAEHFHKLTPNWTENYNWLVQPNTGAYNISSTKLGHSITFKKNQNWWAKDYKYNKYLYNFDTINFKVFRSLEASWRGFLLGEIDYITLPQRQWRKWNSYLPELNLGYVKKLTAYTDKASSVQTIFLNLNKKIWHNPNTRYGFAHCIDKKNIIKDILKSNAHIANQIYVGYGPFTDQSIKHRKFDIDLCNQLLNSASFIKNSQKIRSKNGLLFEIKLIYSDSRHEKILDLLKSQLKTQGILLKINLLEKVDFYLAIKEGDYDALYTSVIPFEEIIPDYRQLFHSKFNKNFISLNFSKISFLMLNNLIEKYENAHMLTTKIELSKKLQNVINQIGSVIPIYYKPFSKGLISSHIQLAYPLGTKYVGIDVKRFWYCKYCHKDLLEAKKAKTPYTNKQNSPNHIIDKTYQNISQHYN